MTNYEKLFGTPERAARTLARMCSIGDGSCAGCPMFKYNIAHCKSDYSDLKSIVEWLESEEAMTDNRTTELLRKLLDERDVEWRETINHANCIFTWWESPTFGTVYAMDNEDGETLFMDCLNNCDLTPEQAIAATLGSDNAKDLLLRTFGLAQMMYDCWLEECKAGDNVDVSACNAYSYEFDQIAQAMFDMGIDPKEEE